MKLYKTKISHSNSIRSFGAEKTFSISCFCLWPLNILFFLSVERSSHGKSNDQTKTLSFKHTCTHTW
ncbi:hypothetical protein NC652_032370 [Populus alba x Populus x berolinensis]|nr:hypothetical protein NC652_032370 [Populus alba x Populus x berolinensis]